MTSRQKLSALFGVSLVSLLLPYTSETFTYSTGIRLIYDVFGVSLAFHRSFMAQTLVGLLLLTTVVNSAIAIFVLLSGRLIDDRRVMTLAGLALVGPVWAALRLMFEEGVYGLYYQTELGLWISVAALGAALFLVGTGRISVSESTPASTRQALRRGRSETQVEPPAERPGDDGVTVLAQPVDARSIPRNGDRSRRSTRERANRQQPAWVKIGAIALAAVGLVALLAPTAIDAFGDFQRGRLPVVGEWEAEQEAVVFRMEFDSDGTGKWETSDKGVVRFFGGGNVGGVDLTAVDSVAAEFTWGRLDNGDYSIKYTGAWPMAGGRRVDATSPDLVAMTMNGYGLYSMLKHDEQDNKVTIVSKGTASGSSSLVFVRPGQPKVASAPSEKQSDPSDDRPRADTTEVPDVFHVLSKHEFVATQEEGGMMDLWDESVQVVTDTLAQAGLKVRIVEVTQDTEGTQDPAAGTQIQEGSTVTVELPVPGWFGD